MEELVTFTILAIWASLTWTNPAADIDALRLVQVRAPGDTVARTLYESGTLNLKLPGLAQQPDSAQVSVSTANYTAGGIRLLLYTHNGAGWSGPSNPLTLFYAARDTTYLGPHVEGRGVSPDWWLGPGMFAYAQQAGDSTFVEWEHAERVQVRERATLCRNFGTWALRGAQQGCP